MVEAIVEYDYKAREKDELSLKKGDIISDITKKPGGWWVGTLARVGKRGMFPDNFVKLLNSGDKKSESPQHMVPVRKCKVLFAYSPLNNDELELQVGDIIDVISEVEEGWWKGKLKNRIGVFPSNFVELTETSPINVSEKKNSRTSLDENTSASSQDLEGHSESTTPMSSPNTKTEVKESQNQDGSNNGEPLPTLPPKPSKEVCRVMYPYEANNDDELTLKEGDIITIVSKEAPDEGWWTGELRGKIGVFPDNFVKLISPAEVKPDRPPVKVNKNRDSITKSSSSASVYMAAAANTSVSRKFSDSIRPEEKNFPPSIGKKPVLPPPTSKKPTLSPSNSDPKPPTKGRESLESEANVMKTSGKIQKEWEMRHKAFSDSVPVSANRSFVQNISTVSKQITSGGETKTSVVESSDSHDGISWSRQSYTVTSTSGSTSSTVNSSMSVVNNGNLNNGNTSANPPSELDLDAVGRAAMLTHPTASRAKVPRRRPPSTLFTREDSKESVEAEVMVNGNVEATEKTAKAPWAEDNKVPWVEELKLSHAKKLGGGKTRVMIGGNEAEPERSGVTLRQTPSTAQRPVSLHAKIPDPPQAQHQQTPETVTVFSNQWNGMVEKVKSLEDKVSNLENQLKTQKEDMMTTIKELTATVEALKLRQRKMSNELEKLTDLVTQV